jgi:hypothetical protein
MTKKLCKKKKLSHKKFPGFELWRECLKGNMEAWEEMRIYNIMDVLSLEELYTKLIPWDKTISFAVYSDEEEMKCNCGNKKLQKRGFNYSNIGKFQRYFCTKCGSWYSGRANLLSKEKRSVMLK